MKVLLIDTTDGVGRRLGARLSDADWDIDLTMDPSKALSDNGIDEYDVLLLCVPDSGLQDAGFGSVLRAGGCVTPLLVLSQRGSAEHVIHGLDCGADDYVVSPVTFGEIRARLQALARRSTASEPEQLVCDDLVVDLAARQVRRGDVPVLLSGKQYAVLVELMQHPGRVLRRSELLEVGWDLAYDGDSNVVDQVVAGLRARIDRPFGRTTVETVRGVGYRIVPPD